LVRVGEKRAERTSRVIARGLVRDQDFRQVMVDSELVSRLEVAVDVSDFMGGDKNWFSYIAKNKPERSEACYRDRMLDETSNYRYENVTSPEERIKLAENEMGGAFIDQFDESQTAELLSLWQGTFGWSALEVDNLRKRIGADKVKESPSERNVWFSGIMIDGKIVTASMAERLQIPGPDGKTLDLVESTEWITEAAHRGKHLMTATIDMLNMQVLRDLRDDGNSRIPLIYAECNFQSRSDRVAHGSGFRIPERSVDGVLIPQILAQNVGVQDGVSDCGPLRDFTFLYLPIDMITGYYKPDQVSRMVSLIKTS
jgi:hypothetical protein